MVIGEILGPGKFRGVPGELTAPNELIGPMQAGHPELKFDPPRWYLDQPFHQNGRTWVVSKMWGRDTEQVLEALASAFPEAGVAYRHADPD